MSPQLPRVRIAEFGTRSDRRGALGLVVESGGSADQCPTLTGHMGTSAMRPRRVGEILDAAIKLYLGNARVLIGAVAVVVVPLQVLYGVVLLSVYTNAHDISAGFTNLGGTTLTQSEAHARLGASLIGTGTNLVGDSLVLAACVKALSDAYLGQQPYIGDSLRFGLRRLLPLIVVVILRGIGLAIGFILLVIPGIWLYAAWSVSIPALVIERTGPFRSLGRSRRLVKGSWWRSAGVLVVSSVLALVVGGLIEGLLTAAALSSGNPSVVFVVVITVLATIVSAVLLQPFAAAVTTVLYYDLRIRREGYDLELVAEQLGIPAASMPSDPVGGGFSGPVGPEHVGRPGGPPYWPPPPGWQPGN
jgi:hypothetical protein